MDTLKIKIRGARENNLKNIDLDIPRGKITAFAGVSGSGKSSVVFDTIAVASTHQLYDIFPLYIRSRMPYRPAPRVDAVENLFAEHPLALSSGYSFNDPSGMCPVCEGLGSIVEFDLNKMIDREKSLNQEAILLPGFTM